jgi:hypothetical protein
MAELPLLPARVTQTRLAPASADRMTFGLLSEGSSLGSAVVVGGRLAPVRKSNTHRPAGPPTASLLMPSQAAAWTSLSRCIRARACPVGASHIRSVRSVPPVASQLPSGATARGPHRLPKVSKGACGAAARALRAPDRPARWQDPAAIRAREGIQRASGNSKHDRINPNRTLAV